MNVHYPEAECALVYEGDPFRLTIAVLLSAQTTDKAVNKVTPTLWERYPTPADLAQADVRDVEDIIRTIGFFHTKAANAIKCAQMVVGEFGGEGAAHHGRAAAPSRRGPQDRQHRAERRLRHRGGHRRGHTRVPRGAQAEVQQRRHAVEDRSRPAEPVSARVLGAHQPPVGAVRPRGRASHAGRAARNASCATSAPAAARSDRKPSLAAYSFAYSSGSTGSSHSLEASSPGTSTDRCENQPSAAAPCQCFTPSGTFDHVAGTERARRLAPFLVPAASAHAHEQLPAALFGMMDVPMVAAARLERHVEDGHLGG